MCFARRPYLRALAVLLALVSALVTPARPVWACSCAMPQSPDLAFSQAHAAFTGTVTTIVETGRYNLLDEFRHWLGRPPLAMTSPRQVTLVVADSWKGVTTTPIEVGTGYGAGDCGFAFNLGGQYLVYAYDNRGVLTTNYCMRTAELAQANVDLAYLQTQPALTVTSAGTSTPVLCGAGALGLLLLLALMAGGAGWKLRRRARAASPPR